MTVPLGQIKFPDPQPKDGHTFRRRLISRVHCRLCGAPRSWH